MSMMKFTYMIMFYLLLKSSNLYAHQISFLNYSYIRAFNNNDYEFITNDYHLETGFVTKELDYDLGATISIDLEKVKLLNGFYQTQLNNNLQLRLGTNDTYFGLFTKDGSLKTTMLSVSPQGVYNYKLVKSAFTNIAGIGLKYSYYLNNHSFETKIIGGVSQSFNAGMLSKALLGTDNIDILLVPKESAAFYTNYSFKDLFKIQLSNVSMNVSNSKTVNEHTKSRYHINLSKLGVVLPANDKANFLFETQMLKTDDGLTLKGSYIALRYYLDDITATYAYSSSVSSRSLQRATEHIIGVVYFGDRYNLGLEYHRGNNKEYVLKDFNNNKQDWDSFVFTFEYKLI